MSEAVKRAYSIYKKFNVFGGFYCKLFMNVFPLLPPESSFEYEDMKSGYKPEEYANTYLRQEVFEAEMSNPFKREEYERLSSYLSEVCRTSAKS